MRNKKNEMLVTFETLEKSARWAACMDALKDEYTLSLKKMCKVLKASRSWVNRYVKPNIHYIYLSNGAGKSANYVRSAREILNRDMTECTWYSRTEFEQLIRDNIRECTRQTIRIPIEELIEPSSLDKFKKVFVTAKQIRQAIDANVNPEYITELFEQRNKAVEKYATDKGKSLWENCPDKYKRKDSKPCAYTLADFDLSALQAVHDLKDYGDTDEEIYRDLFNKGAIRLVVALPDADGVMSEKIYYLYDNAEIDTIEMVLVKYEDYVSECYNII